MSAADEIVRVLSLCEITPLYSKSGRTVRAWLARGRFEDAWVGEEQPTVAEAKELAEAHYGQLTWKTASRDSHGAATLRGYAL